MIKNVVFDLGGVLLEYEPKRFLMSFGFKPEIMAALKKAVFEHDIWLELDRGTYTFAEAVEIIAGLNPGLDKEIRALFNEKRDLLFGEMHESVAFMRRLKNEGYDIYFLSNFSREGFSFVEGKYGFLQEAKGRIISSAVGHIKPEPEIYLTLLNTYDLKPDETVFIDDMEKNVEAARELGIRAIRFTDANDLKQKFREMSG